MPTILFKNLLISAFMCCAMLLSASINAATVSYQAITDFPIIDAGDVPYYVDTGRQALAINAAMVEHRNRFAQATAVFDGQPGIYQLTLVAIAELDGEADYRLSVNGEIVGLASNPEVAEEFVVVRHQFDGVTLSAGAIIGVESLANSNGKIPENDEFAFARGRWTMLEISDSDEGLSAPDLSLVASIVGEDLQVGDELDIAVSVDNGDNNEVATGVIVSVSLPADSLELIDQSVCSANDDVLRCELAEVTASDSIELSINLRSIAELTDAPIVISVSSDQTDLNGSNNSVELLLSVDETSMGGSEGGMTSAPEIDQGTMEPESGDTDPGISSGGMDRVLGSDNVTRSNSSGGGSLSLLFLLCFAGYVVPRYTRG